MKSEPIKPNTMDDWLDEILKECVSGGFNKTIPEEMFSEVFRPGQALSKAKALITAKIKEVDRAARIDTANIQDWTNRGLESAKPEVWFRCLQLINDELAYLKGGDDE